MRLCLSCFLLLSSLSCFAGKKKVAVQQCFEHYKSAVLKNDGATALNYISSSTIKLYTEIIDWALHADSIKVHNMTVMNKISVLAIRAEKEKSELNGISGEQLFIEAVEKDKVDKLWLSKFELDHISFEDSVAYATATYEGDEIMFKFRFVYEHKSWRFDLLSFFRINEYLIRQDIQESGNTENGYILDFLKQSYGNLPENTLWHPLK